MQPDLAIAFFMNHAPAVNDLIACKWHQFDTISSALLIPDLQACTVEKSKIVAPAAPDSS